MSDGDSSHFGIASIESQTFFCICRKSRTTFDTSDTRRAYGPIIIDYTKVQAKVTLKYDSWHKEALSKFGTLLGNEMQTFHAKVSKSRNDLEMQSIGTYDLFSFESIGDELIVSI